MARDLDLFFIFAAECTLILKTSFEFIFLIFSKFSKGKPNKFLTADFAEAANHKGKENPFFKSTN